MIAIFIVGCFITAIVAAACWCVVAGLRADMHRTSGEGAKRSEGISEPEPRLPS